MNLKSYAYCLNAMALSFIKPVGVGYHFISCTENARTRVVVIKKFGDFHVLIAPNRNTRHGIV